MDKEKIKIMLVDDEENIRRALKRILKRDGYNVVVYGNPEEALKSFSAEEPDIVISDYLMPEMNGVDFLKKAQDIFPECIRIILTAHADVTMAVEAINTTGIFRLLVKPWDDKELKMLLQQINEHMAIIKENAKLRSIIRKHEDILKKLEVEYPGISEIKRLPDGTIVIE